MAEILRTADHSIHFTHENFREPFGDHVLRRLLALGDDGEVTLMLNGVKGTWARWKRGAMALKPFDMSARRAWAATEHLVGTWLTLAIVPPTTTQDGTQVPHVVVHGQVQMVPFPDDAPPPVRGDDVPAASAAALPPLHEMQRDGARLFDFYIMVDWSSNAGPNNGPDSIWIGYADVAGEIVVSNPRTRQAALTYLLYLETISKHHFPR